ncbi:MAG: SPOR domain-containing protein [Steroidobacteraceae bacterium]
MRHSAVICLGALALGLMLCVAGCSHEGADWKAASSADTSEAYQQFLQQHPNSANAAQAHTRIQQLQEVRDWQAAGAADTRDAYEQFLAQHPDSQWAQEARIRVENFAQSGAPAAPPAIASPAPAPRRAGVSGSAAPAKGPARAEASLRFVQLGAFSSQAHAQLAWNSLSAKYPQLLGALQPRYVSSKRHGRSLVRLEVAVPTRAAATSLCASLKKHAQSCAAVRA